MPHSVVPAAKWLAALLLSAALVISAQTLINPHPRSLADLIMPDLRQHGWPSCAVGAPSGNSMGSRRILLVHDDDPTDPGSVSIQATLLANMSSHFGEVVTTRLRNYRSKDLLRYDALLYVGSRADEVLPKDFRSDVLSGKRPVLWLKENIEELTSARDFWNRYGWLWQDLDGPDDFTLTYRGMTLRPSGEGVGLTRFARVDRKRSRVVATAQSGKETLPWAITSQHLTYVADLPLGTTSTQDASLALADLLHDVVPRSASTDFDRHRALVRIEDVGPKSNPDDLRAVSRALKAEGVPFSFTLYPLYVGPIGSGPRQRVALSDRPQVVRAIVEMLDDGATMVSHGYTHQFEDRKNPRSGESGTDYEFFLAHLDGGGDVVYDSAVPGDSQAWAADRMNKALAAIGDVGLPRPQMFTVPHYAASPGVYAAISTNFSARYDRGQFFSPAWNGRPPASPYLYEQATPYLSKDSYGSVVVPENLGYLADVSPAAVGPNTRTDVLAGAKALLQVRDSVASFFYHPYLGTEPVVDVVRKMRSMGYTFVSPCEL